VGKEIYSDMADMGRQTVDRLMRSFSKVAAISVLVLVLQTASAAWCTETAQKPVIKSAGSFFGMPVPEDNYYFIKSVVMVFGNKFGPQPKTDKERESVIWDQLLLSFEAFKRNIVVGPEEVGAEIDKMLSAEGAAFDRKKEKAAYEEWLKKRVNEPVNLFENQIRHLIQMEKLREDVMKSIDPLVSDEEAHRAFLNENSSLDVELVQFDSEKDANDFYIKVRKDKKAWDKRKEKSPAEFKRPGGVTVQFLLDFWKIPERAQHEMVGMKPGEFHSPEPIYKGWGVFKVIGSTKAEEEAWNAASKEHYIGKMKTGKKYEGYNDWFRKTKEAADIKVDMQIENKENGNS